MGNRPYANNNLNKLNKIKSLYKLKIISSSVRPGRKGPLVAGWMGAIAKQHPDFEVEVLDLGEINLPMMNEANHPVLQKYEHQHSKN